MPLIDPRQDPRLVPIPHPAVPTPQGPPPEIPTEWPNIPAPPPPPPGPMQGPVPPAEGPPPGMLDQIISTFNIPRDFAWSGVPGGHAGVKETFFKQLDAPSRIGPIGELDPSRLAWRGIGGLTGRGGQETAYDILTDPLTFILNRGAVAAVGEGAAAVPRALPAGAATADQIVRAFSLADKYINDVAELPLRGALKVAGGTVKGLASIPGSALGMRVVDPESGPRTARSLHDWATHQSPQTALHMIERQIENVNAQLRHKGHSLEMGLSDWAGRRGLTEWPGNLADATTELGNLQNELIRQVIDTSTTNPHAAPYGQVIVHQIDQFRDILNSRFRSLQAEHRAAGTPAPEAARAQELFIRESWQSLTDMVSGAREVFDDIARDLHGPSLGGALDPKQMATVSRKLQGRMEQMKFLHHDLPGMMADLPNQFRSSSGSWYESLLNRSMTDYARRYGDLKTHLRDFEQGLKDTWEYVKPGEAFPSLLAKTPEERLSNINNVLEQMGMAPVKGAGELYERLAPRLPVTQANKLRDHLDFWGEDILSGDLFDTVGQRVVREHAKNLGIEKPTGVKKLGQDALQFWKTQAIDTPAYLLSNLMGGVTMGALRGVSPMPVFRGLAENVGVALRGGNVEVSPLKRINEMLDIVTPHEVTSATGASFLNNSDDVKALIGRSQNIMERIGAPKLAVAGGLQGAYSGATDTPGDQPENRATNTLVGAGLGAASWGTLPVTSKFLLTRLGTGLEAVMRQTAYLKAMTQGVESRAGELLAIGQNALTAPRGGAAPSMAGLTGALDELRGRAGFISGPDLEDFLFSHGVDPDIARTAGTQWRDKIQDAVSEGSKFANQIHFDYEDLNNVQQVAKNFMPFATWGMKAYPFFMEELVKNPLVSMTLLRMTLDQEKERKEGRLTDRFAGAVHVPALDSFWSTITGKDQKVYVNPTRGLLPFSDISQLGTINENDTPLDAASKGMSAFGFSLRPDIEAALRLTPLTSGSAPAQGFWRHSAPLQGLSGQLGAASGRGVDLDAPIKDAETALRLAFRGLEPTNITESNVLRRLDELSIRETGKPISSGHMSTVPYLEARYLRQGQLWDRAQAEVSREGAGRSLYGLLTQIGAPRALLGQEEEKIREAQARGALQDPKVNQEIKKELQAGNHAKMRPDLIPPLQRAAQTIAARYGESNLAPEVQQILMIPTVANLEQLRKWVSEGEAESNPLHLGYSSGGSPEEVRLSSALTAYYSLPFQMRQDPAMKGQPPEKIEELTNLHAFASEAGARSTHPTLGPIVRYATQRRDQMLAQEPILAAYLRWQQAERGYGNPRQFVREVWGNEAKRRQLLTAEDAKTP